MSKMKILYVTFPSRKDAERLAKILLKKKLIFCANIFPIISFYWWEGKIEKSKEFVLIAKTLEEKEEKAREEIEKLHAYQIPFIGSWEVAVNKKYLEYAKKALK